MGLVINTNVSALSTAAALNKSGESLRTSMERLSTGKEINSAADNAAGKAIATNMTKQLNALEQGISNAKDGENLLATMDSAAGAIEDMTQRMRTLAVQSLNGTYQDADRTLLDVEFQALMQEITRVAENTEFNGKSLIAAETIDAVNTPLDIAAWELTSAVGDIMSNTMTANASLDIQVGDKSGDAVALTSTGLDAASLGFDSIVVSDGTGALGAASAAVTASVGTAVDATIALKAVDNAMDKITDARTNFGAQANRLSHTGAALESSATNTAAARSQIEDADFAKETTNLARAKVLQNAGIAMLQQANAQTSNVEQLLR